jgi:RecG-like helicase
MGLKDMFHRLASSAAELDAEELREQTQEVGGTPIVTCLDRQRAKIVGTVRTVTLRPRAGVPALEAEVWDGSAMLNVVWLGRRQIVAIEPGRQIMVEGLVQAHDGERLMFNPRYELKPVGS